MKLSNERITEPFGGEECEIVAPAEIEQDNITDFDQPEEICWDCIKGVCEYFGCSFKNEDEDDTDEPYDNYASKQVLETILDLMKEAGISIKFNSGD